MNSLYFFRITKLFASFVYVIVFVMLSGSIAVAQSKVSLGLKAGMNLYNVKIENTTMDDSRIGLVAGLFGHIHLATQIGFQPEIVYSAQGGSFKVGDVTTKIKLDYINVPMLLQYMFNNGFRLEAGPQIGFLVSAKSKTNDVTTDIKDNFKTFDFAIGAGVSYVHPPTGFGIDARYNFGLSNINDVTDAKTTNRGLQITLFYLFGHKY